MKDPNARKNGKTLKLKLELSADDRKPVEREVVFELSDDEMDAVYGGFAPPATIPTHDYDDDIKDKV